MVYKAVNGMGAQGLIWQGRLIGFFETPMLLPLFIVRSVVYHLPLWFHLIGLREGNTQLDPFGKHGNILVRHLAVGWHLMILILVGSHLQKEAACWVL